MRTRGGNSLLRRLARRGHEVAVYEQGELPGGLASSFEVAPGTWLERFCHHLLRSDRHALALIGELGLAARLRWHRPASTVMVGDIPWHLDSPLWACLHGRSTGLGYCFDETRRAQARTALTLSAA